MGLEMEFGWDSAVHSQTVPNPFHEIQGVPHLAMTWLVTDWEGVQLLGNKVCLLFSQENWGPAEDLLSLLA